MTFTDRGGFPVMIDAETVTGVHETTEGTLIVSEHTVAGDKKPIETRVIVAESKERVDRWWLESAKDA